MGVGGCAAQRSSTRKRDVLLDEGRGALSSPAVAPLAVSEPLLLVAGRYSLQFGERLANDVRQWRRVVLLDPSIECNLKHGNAGFGGQTRCRIADTTFTQCFCKRC